MWWLNAEVDDPSQSDCSQAALTGRTLLVDATMNSSGKGSLGTVASPVHLPPPGGTPGAWSYGTNWLCATTAPAMGTGTVGDQQFAIYPA